MGDVDQRFGGVRCEVGRRGVRLRRILERHGSAFAPNPVVLNAAALVTTPHVEMVSELCLAAGLAARARRVAARRAYTCGSPGGTPPAAPSAFILTPRIPTGVVAAVVVRVALDEGQARH